MTDEKIFSVDKPEDSSGFLLWQVTNMWQRAIRQALAPYDITHSQFVLLASILWLSESGAPITQIVLSGHTKIDPMTTSIVLRTLQKKQLITRTEHATDTRAKTVCLTPQGRTLAAQAIKIIEEFDRDFFSQLGAALPAFNNSMIALLTASR
jgi:MarR family transcriptional regulator, organic hydroperoxide resistance regulator